MKKIKSILTCCIMLVTLNTFSQNSNYEDVVYLKNGSVIHGVIIEQVPSKTIKIKTYDGNIFVYKMEEIEKMTKEERNKQNEIYTGKNIAAKENKTTHKNKTGFIPHYSFIAEGGYFFGIGEVSTDELPYYDLKLTNEDGGYSLRTVHGYQASDHFLIGAGVGVDIFRSLILMPLSLDARFFLGKSNVRPYLNTALGYAVPLKGDKGGYLFNLGLGVKASSTWAFNLGYRLQSTDWVFKYQGYLYKVNGTGKFISISSNYFF